MSSDPSAGQQVLLGALNRQREHVLAAADGLGPNDLRRPVLPSGWSCIGLVNHLSLDVERFWFRAVIPGAKSQSGMLSPAWKVSDGEPVEDVLHRYRDNIEHADAIIATRSTASARSRSTS